MGIRARANIPGEFRSGRVRGSGQIRDLSQDGLFLGTDQIPEEGETVRVVFDSPLGERAQLLGLVWWTSRGKARCPTPGFGLRLLSANRVYRDYVRSLLG
jgi:hypothetical protein